MASINLETLVSEYAPSSRSLRTLKSVNLIVVVGPTAVGKSTLIRHVVNADERIVFVPTHTSRPPRVGETNGVDLYFETKTHMLEGMKRGIYTQVAIGPTGDLYATQVEDYPTDGFGILPVVSGAVSVFRNLPFCTCRTIVVVPPSYERWQEWLDERAMSAEEKTKRLTEAVKSFEFALEDDQALFVVNNVLEKTTRELIQVIYGREGHSQERGKKYVEALLRCILK